MYNILHNIPYVCTDGGERNTLTKLNNEILIVDWLGSSGSGSKVEVVVVGLVVVVVVLIIVAIVAVSITVAVAIALVPILAVIFQQKQSVKYV